MADKVTESDLTCRLAELARQLEPVLDEVLEEGRAVPPLREAMRAAVLAGGKRFRPYLVASCCELLEVPRAAALRAGAAVELLHAASLILDDLPAMDNAESRRGGKAIHLRFGEAEAILAATALIALGFQTLADQRTCPDAERRSQLIARCALAIGPAGMSGGQALDIMGIEGAPHKTADLAGFCCEIGALLGQSSPAVRGLLSDFGIALGLAYQARDDLLDEGASSKSKAGGDSHGLHARGLAMRLVSEFGYPSDQVAPLLALADWSATRTC